MILEFYDRDFRRVGTASDTQRRGAIVSGYSLKRSVANGANALEFDLHNGGKIAAAGNYIIVKRPDRSIDFFTIIENDDSFGVPHIYAEDAGIELLNSTFGEYKASGPQGADYYLNLFAGSAGFDVGINQFENHVRTIKWESDNTGLERVVQTANRFGAELQFRFELDDVGNLRKYIDLYERIGSDTGLTLTVGKEITGLHIKDSIADLVTGLKPVGGMPEGSDVNITLADLSSPYDDGDIYSQGTYLYSRSAWEKWRRFRYEKTTGNGHLIRRYSYDTDNVAELLNRSVSELKKYNHNVLTYSADIAPGFEGVSLGDSVQVVDKERDVTFKARVIEVIEHSAAPEFTLEAEG